MRAQVQGQVDACSGALGPAFVGCAGGDAAVSTAVVLHRGEGGGEMNEDERERAELMLARLRAERDAPWRAAAAWDARGRIASSRTSRVPRCTRYLETGSRPGRSGSGGNGPRGGATLLNADGCVSRAREMLLAKGADPLPGVRQMQRAREQMPSALKVSLTDGEAAARQYELTAKVEIRERNELWLADHKQLDVMAMPPRGNVLRPWLTVIEDSATRRVLGASCVDPPQPRTRVGRAGHGAARCRDAGGDRV